MRHLPATLALGGGEAGREIEGPMAIVILGGLLTSPALNLLVLPALALRYGKFAPCESVGLKADGWNGEAEACRFEAVRVERAVEGKAR